tara:strand:+ start:3263 stop:4294 length:1032 start_codon:yes stop_codon:yes gene_type:complete
MESFQFEHINLLWLLVVLPLLVLAYFIYLSQTKRRIKKIGNPDLIAALAPENSTRKRNIRFILYLFVFLFLIIAVAKPQLGSKLETIERKGVDLVLALDVSKSMLAEDITPNRLERAKLFASKLIDNLKGDRLGIIVYAGQAYAQMAITSDYAAAKMFLNNINTNIVPSQGTDIAGAVNMAEKYLSHSETKERVLYIISDGENHEEGAIEAVSAVYKKGVQVHCLGVGMPEGGPIPRKRGSSDFKKDRDGNVVITKLDAEMLQKIAQAGGGSFAHLVSVQSAVDFFIEEISGLEKTKFESKRYSDYEDQYQWFLGFALLFLCIEIILPNTKSNWIRKWKVFDV